MMYYTHLVAAFLFSLIFIKLFNVSSPIVFISICLIAGLLPDLDHPKSKLGKYFRPINLLFEHRGFFHSFLVLPVIALILYYFNYSSFALPIIVGYVSHLISDAMTIEGIMPFHPFSKFRISGFIRTGSAFEIIFFVLLLILTGYVMM